MDSYYAFDPEVDDFLPAMAFHGQHLGLAALHSFGIVAEDKDVTHLSSLALAATTKAPQLAVFNSRNVLSQLSGMEVQDHSL